MYSHTSVFHSGVANSAVSKLVNTHNLHAETRTIAVRRVRRQCTSHTSSNTRIPKANGASVSGPTAPPSRRKRKRDENDNLNDDDDDMEHDIPVGFYSPAMLKQLGLSGCIADVEMNLPTHTFIGGGSISIPPSKHAEFELAYIADADQDYAHNFRASKQRVSGASNAGGVGGDSKPSAAAAAAARRPHPQLSVNEFAHSGAFRLYFDLDYKFARKPDENDQALIGLNTVIILAIVKTCFAKLHHLSLEEARLSRIDDLERAMEEWETKWRDELGVCVVTQTLARPEFPSSSLLLPHLKQEMKDARAAAENHYNNYVYLNEEKTNDGLSMNEDSLTCPSPGSFASAHLRASSHHTHSRGLASGSSTPANNPNGLRSSSMTMMHSENSNDGGTSTPINIFSRSLDTDLEYNSSSIDVGISSSNIGRSSAQPSITTTSTTSQQTLSDSRSGASSNSNSRFVVAKSGIMEPKEHVESVTVSSTPLDLRVQYHIGIHQHWPNLIVDCDKAKEIRLAVIDALVKYVAMNRSITSETSLLAHHKSNSSVPVSSINSHNLRDVWGDIVDNKVFTPTPHCRKLFSHKLGKCLRCAIPSSPTPHNQPISKHQNKKMALSPIQNDDLLEQHHASLPPPQLSDSSSSSFSAVGARSKQKCPACGGTGKSSHGHPAIASVVYMLNGDGKMHLSRVFDALVERSDYSLSTEKNTHDYAHLAYPPSSGVNKGSLYLLQKMAPPEGMSSNLRLAKYLKKNPIRIPLVPNRFDSPVITISSLPDVLERFPNFQPEARKKYIALCVSMTSICVPAVSSGSDHLSPDDLKLLHTPGFIVPGDIYPSVNSNFESLSPSMLISKSHGTNVKKTAADVVVSALRGGIPVAAPPSSFESTNTNSTSNTSNTTTTTTTQDTKRFKILVSDVLESQLRHLLRFSLIKERWYGLEFEYFNYIASSNPLPIPPYKRHTLSSFQIAALEYAGPSYLAYASDNTECSRWCAIRSRCHKSCRSYFRITPTCIIHLCGSVSSDRPRGMPACCFDFGGVWPYSRSLGRKLFVEVGNMTGVARKQASKLMERENARGEYAASLDTGNSISFGELTSDEAAQPSSSSSVGASSTSAAMRSMEAAAIAEMIDQDQTGVAVGDADVSPGSAVIAPTSINVTALLNQQRSSSIIPMPAVSVTAPEAASNNPLQLAMARLSAYTAASSSSPTSSTSTAAPKKIKLEKRVS